MLQKDANLENCAKFRFVCDRNKPDAAAEMAHRSVSTALNHAKLIARRATVSRYGWMKNNCVIKNTFVSGGLRCVRVSDVNLFNRRRVSTGLNHVKTTLNLL